MPPKAASPKLSHVVIAYNTPFQVERQTDGTLRQNRAIGDPNGIFANTTKMPFMLGNAYIEQSEMAWQGLKEMVSATHTKPATPNLFQDVVTNRADRGDGSAFRKISERGASNPELHPKKPEYNEALALEFMTQIQHIKFSQYEGLLQEIIVMLEQVREEGQSLSEAFEEKFEFVEDCPSSANPAQCRDDRWGGLFDPRTGRTEGRNLQGQAVKEGIKRVLLDYEEAKQAGKERLQHKYFYSFKDSAISAELAKQLNTTTNPAIPKKAVDAVIDPNRSFGISPTACYDQAGKLVYHNAVNSNPTRNIDGLTDREASPLATSAPAAAPSSALDPAAAALVQTIIAGQAENYAKWFTNPAIATYEFIVNRGKHPTVGDAHFDWYVFPSSSLNRSELSVQGRAVYTALAQDANFIARYRHSLATYLKLVADGLRGTPSKLISHTSQQDHIVRFNKLVESYVGLTNGGARLIYETQAQQDQTTKLICDIWEKHKATSHPGQHNAQFFTRLESMAAEAARRPVVPAPATAPSASPATPGLSNDNIAYDHQGTGLLGFFDSNGVTGNAVVVDPAGTAFSGGAASANLADSGAGGLSGPIYTRLGANSRPAASPIIGSATPTDRVSGGLVTKLYVADACFNEATSVIHAVGPSISIIPGTDPTAAIKQFQTELKLTIQNIIASWQASPSGKAKTLAIPLISGGIFFTGSDDDKKKHYYPCLLDAVDEELKKLAPDVAKRVKIVPYGDKEVAALKDAMATRRGRAAPAPAPSVAAPAAPSGNIVPAENLTSPKAIVDYVTTNIRNQSDRKARSQALKTKVQDRELRWDLLTYAIGSNWSKLDAASLNKLMNDMIGNGADYNARNDDGTTFLHHLVRWHKGATTAKEREKAFEVIKEFVTKHKPALFQDRDNLTPFDLLDNTPADRDLYKFLKANLYVRNHPVSPTKLTGSEISDYEKGKFGVTDSRNTAFLSDHTVVKFSATTDAGEAKIFSWNMMNQCRDDKKKGYSNNPVNFNETGGQYRVRLDREVDYIEALLEQEHPDFFNLQEAQGLFEITARGHKKLDQNFVARMRAKGYEIVAPDEGKNLLTIYKIGRDVAKPIYKLGGGADIHQDLYDGSGYSTTSVITFTHASGKRIAIGNMHLDYQATAFPGLRGIQQDFTTRGVPCILTGDTNHTVEQMEVMVPGSVGDKGHATCFDCIGVVGTDGKTIYNYAEYTSTDARAPQPQAKSYDLAIGNGLAAITVESYREFVADRGRITQQERKLVAAKKPAPLPAPGAAARALEEVELARSAESPAAAPAAPLVDAGAAAREAEGRRVQEERRIQEEAARKRAAEHAERAAQEKARREAEALRAQEAKAAAEARKVAQKAASDATKESLKGLLQADLVEWAGLTEEQSKYKLYLTLDAIKIVVSEADRDSFQTINDEKRRVVQPFSISKAAILKAAVNIVMDHEEYNKVPQEYRVLLPAERVVDKTSAESKAEMEIKKTKGKTEEADKRIPINADMMGFQTEITEETRDFGNGRVETRQVTNTYIFTMGFGGELLPPPGLAYATFSGLQLRDASENKMFPKGVDITYMNFNNCDLTGLDFSGISKEMFETLKFSASCTGLDTIIMPEGAKLKTSAISTQYLNGENAMAPIGSEETAEEIMERPTEHQNPQKYLERPKKLKNEGVEKSLERLRPSGSATNPEATALEGLRRQATLIGG